MIYAMPCETIRFASRNEGFGRVSETAGKSRPGGQLRSCAIAKLLGTSCLKEPAKRASRRMIQPTGISAKSQSGL